MPLRVRSVIRQFLTWAEGALAPNTVQAYRHQLLKFIANTKNKDVHRLCPADVTRWAKSWHEVQAIVRVLNWAMHEEKLIKRNPLARMRKPGRGMRRRTLTPKQMALLIRSCTPAARLFLIAMRETAARPQEIRAAKWEHLQSDTPELSIEEALVAGRALIVQYEFKDCRRRSDQQRPRVLLVSRHLGRILNRVLKFRVEKSGPIFLNTLGRPWTKNAVRCFMRRLRRRCGFVKDERGEQVTSYTFRHSLLTWLAATNASDRIVADVGGHVDIRTTQRYVHLRVKHLRRAMAKISRNRAKARQNANRS